VLDLTIIFERTFLLTAPYRAFCGVTLPCVRGCAFSEPAVCPVLTRYSGPSRPPRRCAFLVRPESDRIGLRTQASVKILDLSRYNLWRSMQRLRTVDGGTPSQISGKNQSGNAGALPTVDRACGDSGSNADRQQLIAHQSRAGRAAGSRRQPLPRGPLRSRSRTSTLFISADLLLDQALSARRPRPATRGLSRRVWP
jgi:hypothetical protein